MDEGTDGSIPPVKSGFVNQMDAYHSQTKSNLNNYDTRATNQSPMQFNVDTNGQAVETPKTKLP